LWIEGERGKLQLVAAGQPLAYWRDWSSDVCSSDLCGHQRELPDI